MRADTFILAFRFRRRRARLKPGANALRRAHFFAVKLSGRDDGERGGGATSSSRGGVLDMQTTCHKCGNPVSADQAFCSKCGAVVGMSDTAQGGEEWNMAATMVGKSLPTTPARPSAAAPQPARESSPPQPAYRPEE